MSGDGLYILTVDVMGGGDDQSVTTFTVENATPVAAFTVPITSPRSVAYDSAGNIYALNDSTIQKHDPTGTIPAPL